MRSFFETWSVRTARRVGPQDSRCSFYSQRNEGETEVFETTTDNRKGTTTMTSSATAVPTQTSTSTWNIDPAHSIAEFKVKHMMIANVKGQFSKVSGALFLDESDLANSRVEATIEAASIHTRDE